METVLISTLLVAIAEIGDKTQLLAIVLAARFKKPVPICLGILAATIANHLLAATGGYFIADLLSGFWFRTAVSAAFIAMAVWTLVPDKIDDDAKTHDSTSAFLATLVSFFFVEIGDKTQVATIALAARFHSVALVATGTTLGMLIADIPAVFLAEKASEIVPLHYVRIGAATIFLLLGGWGLAEALGWFA